MNIISTSYTSQSDVTKVEVQVSESITSDVIRKTEIYEVDLAGMYDFESDELYDAVVDKLSEAGINVMPF